MSGETDRLEEQIARLAQRVAQLEARMGVEPPHDVAAAAPARKQAASAAPARPAAARTIDVEQWLGQRGLLFVGIVALLAAAAFFLKYAFDRGWIPPTARAALAVAAGIGLAVFGEHQVRHGLRKYGVAMIGAGGALAYLGIWAAAGPFALVAPGPGILLLAGLAAVATQRAIHHASEPLASWATFGALLAPVLLATPHPSAQAFFGYLDVVLVAAALLAWYFAWRNAFAVAVAGVIVLSVFSDPAWLGLPAGLLLLVTIGMVVLIVTERHRWPPIRVLALSVVVLVLMEHGSRTGAASPERWLALLGALALCAVLMRQDRGTQVATARTPDEASAEILPFVVAPVAPVVLANAAPPAAFPSADVVVPSALAAGYAALGWRPRSPAFMGMAGALVAAALLAVTTGLPLIPMWAALAVACTLVDRQAGQPGLRPVALAAAGLSWTLLFTLQLGRRPGAAPAFTDAWALALYGYIALTAVAAAAWKPLAAPASPLVRQGGVALWALAAIALFLGITIDLNRYFEALSPAWPRAELAGRLAISLWWVIYAAAAIRIGFMLESKAVRLAGLVVAVVATQKVWLYDMAALDALYRVAAFFALALMTLAVAYAYHRRGRAAET